MEISYLKILVTICLSVLGLVCSHYFTSKRTTNNKRRDLTTDFLIEAFRILTTKIAHRKETEDRAQEIENLVSDIQLFGSNEQVEMAKKLADEVAQGGAFDLDPIINSLRDSLRSELGLKAVNGNVRWLRFKK
jgi:hypothetical protein